MTAVLAATVLAAILAPHVIAARRALTISRATFRSHRDSVRVGVRLGRYQTITVLIMTALLVISR